MADFFKNLDKYVKDWHILTLLGLLILGYIIYEYSGKQNLLVSNYQGVTSQRVTPSSTPRSQPPQQGGNPPVSSGLPSGVDNLQDNLNGPAILNQLPTTIQNVPTPNVGNQQNLLNPQDLLPRDTNSQWAQSQNVTPGISGMNFLDNNSLMIGTQSQTLRNANQQLRADPVIPAGPAPCFQTTITKDDTGVGLQVGC